ncbi:PLDc N-terminal domain-containing protein [Zhihengliuella sp.]|uniref:PLDc N-terminal domain-containing protein n=1 Tax=Zhihengliuella sp. TaxID=1954483 RepID=UPI0028121497|nr:PLDc N-terminal domain-containing protein [Zhihengliuella sp.]
MLTDSAAAAAPAGNPALEWLLTAAIAAWVVAVVVAMVRIEKTRHRRDATGTLGWVVVVLCVPVLGALCWFFFDHAATQTEQEAAAEHLETDG